MPQVSHELVGVDGEARRIRGEADVLARAAGVALDDDVAALGEEIDPADPFRTAVLAGVALTSPLCGAVASITSRSPAQISTQPLELTGLPGRKVLLHWLAGTVGV